MPGLSTQKPHNQANFQGSPTHHPEPKGAQTRHKAGVLDNQWDNVVQNHRRRSPTRMAQIQPICRQKLNGETRIRTGDTTIFSRVLYQLSYLAAELPSTFDATCSHAAQRAVQALAPREFLHERLVAQA